MSWINNDGKYNVQVKNKIFVTYPIIGVVSFRLIDGMGIIDKSKRNHAHKFSSTKQSYAFFPASFFELQPRIDLISTNKQQQQQ